MSLLISTEGAIAAIAGGTAGAAIGADQLINDDLDYAAKDRNIAVDIYQNNPDANGAANYIYGDANVAPIDRQFVSKILAGDPKTESYVTWLNNKSPGMGDRVLEIQAKAPDTAMKVRVAEELGVKATVAALATDDGPESPGERIMEMRESAGPNQIAPLLVGGGASAGLMAIANAMSKRGYYS